MGDQDTQVNSAFHPSAGKRNDYQQKLGSKQAH